MKFIFTHLYRNSRRLPAQIICFLLVFPFTGIAQTYEAEHGVFSGSAGVSSCTLCSSGNMAGNIGGDGAVTIPVTVATAGNYNLTIYYCTGDQRAINVTPNTDSLISVTCPSSGGWTTVAATTVTVALQAGNNTLRFDNAHSWGPNLDKIVLSLQNVPNIKSIAFGTNNRIDYDLNNGLYDVYFNNQKIISGASATAYSNSALSSVSTFTNRTYTSQPVNDSFGSGTKHIITLSNNSQLQMQQVFYTYTGKNFFLTELLLNGPNSNCYKMSVLTSNNADIHAYADRRALLVPFDNDAWVRYQAERADTVRFTGAEVGAIYDNTSRKGLLAGSVEHEVWKTGISIGGEGRTDNHTAYLSVIAGYTDQNLTRDKRGHGWVGIGKTSCKSPKIMIDYQDDWRSMFDEYGRANAMAEPRYVHAWTGAAPYGWNSWGAIQTNLNLSKAKAVVDYFANDLTGYRNGDSTLYIDLDSYWTNMTGNSLTGDFSQLISFVNYCKSKGFKPGIYWAPFVDWGKWSRTVEGSSYNYDQCWTKVNSAPFDMDGAYAMDPTHPGTKDRIKYLINRFKSCGFEMIKLDFLAHASVEADQFYDQNVHTGMEAFKEGMEYIVDQIAGTMLINVAISPNLATGRYAHWRRIACDAYSDIWESAYTLNSTNYGWWQSHIYQYLDADNIVFGTQTEGKNRARLTSAIVTGTLLAGDDYSSDGIWKTRAQTLLQNEDLLRLPKDGIPFLPVEGNTGWDPNNFFIKTIGNHTYLAVLNYGNDNKTYTVDLQRLSLNGSYITKELFSHANMGMVQGTFSITIPAADAAIVEFTSTALPVEIVNIHAIKKSNSTLVTWQTASEVNNKEYIIERSTDLRNFTALGTVQSIANTGKINSYSFIDSTPAANTINYYRLRQVDNDGKYTYSVILPVHFEVKAMLAAYPNPATSELTIKLPAPLPGRVTIKIQDMHGKTVSTKVLNNPPLQFSIGNIGNLVTGTYVLVIESNLASPQKIKFIKY